MSNCQATQNKSNLNNQSLGTENVRWIKWHENTLNSRKTKHLKNGESFGLFGLNYMQRKIIWDIAGKIDWLDHKGS